MKRRHVLGLLGGSATAAAIGGGALLTPVMGARAADGGQGWSAGAGATQPADGDAAIAIVRNGGPAAMVDAALAALGGMGRFVSSGQTVLVKPNMGWDRTPEQAANTNPEVMARLVQLALEAGAKKVTVLDRTCNDARRCYASSGIVTAVEAVGAKVVHVDDNRVTRTDMGGEFLDDWDIYDEVLKADVKINVPIAKHHMLSRLTLGMKNWMGCVGGNRSLMHQKINHAVVDMAAFFKPQLTVLDAYRILTANGPTGGNLNDVRDAKTLCAGTDPVAVDAFGASLFGQGPDDMKHIGLAEARGLGKSDLGALNVREIDLAGA